MQMSGQKAKSLKQNMFDHGQTFTSIATILHHSKVSELGLDQLEQFSNTDNICLSETGRNLKSNCLRFIAFFKTLKKACCEGIYQGIS
jgi:hypothetical protein